MYKIGVIGDRESVVCFQAVGLNTFPCDDPQEAVRLIRGMAEDYGIIYIIEDLAAEISREIDRYKEQKLPAIIPIPGKGGPIGEGMRSVKDAVRQAVGADILFGGNNE